MKQDKTVVFIGEPCVDEYYQLLQDWPLEGNKFVTQFKEKTSGGMIANAASVMASYGIKTYLFCQLFQDENYSYLINDLQNYHVDTSKIIPLEDGRNGKCEIYISKRGERTINVVNGDQKKPLPYQKYLPFLTSASYLYASLTTVQMFDDPLSLLKECKESGVKIVFDNESSCYREDWQDYLQYAYVSSMNEYAIDLYSNQKGEEALRETLFSLGVEIVVETLGEKGSKICTKENIIQIPTYPVTVVDTTGAGDTFNSSFTYGLLQEMSLEDAGRFASGAASLAIQKPGGRSGATSFAQVEQFIKEMEEAS